MAAFAGQGQTLTGNQVQPEIEILLDHLESGTPLNFRIMPHATAQILRKMKQELLSHISLKETPKDE
jgi:hypothetical protein